MVGKLRKINPAGVLMYQLCTLKYPFKAESVYGIAEEILSNCSFPRIPKQYSDELNEIVQLMLIRDFKKRPSVEQLLEMEYFKRVWEYFQTDQKDDTFTFKNISKSSEEFSDLLIQ